MSGPPEPPIVSQGLRPGALWRWSNLRAIGNLPAVKMTVLIPLIGYMVIFNENVLPYLQLSRAIFGEHTEVSVHVSARLIAIYFGLCFLGVGSLVYQIFCPKEVKRHETAPDYVSAWSSIIGDGAVMRIERGFAANSAIRKEYEHSKDRITARYRAGTESQDEMLAKLRPALLEAHFRYLDETRSVARISTFLCDTLGFIILAVPSIEVFYRVTTLAVHPFAEVLQR
jgi:hypothetical protein